MFAIAYPVLSPSHGARITYQTPTDQPRLKYSESAGRTPRGFAGSARRDCALVGVPGAGQGQESALGTRVVVLSPRGKPLGFSAPALPGPGLAALFPVFGSAGVSLVKGKFLSRKREPRFKTGVGGLQASTREGKRGIVRNYFTVFPKFHKTAHDDAGDLPNTWRI